MKTPNTKASKLGIVYLRRASSLCCFLPLILMLLTMAINGRLKAQEALQLQIDSIYGSGEENELKIPQLRRLIAEQDTAVLTAELGYAYHRLGLLFNRVGDYQSAVEETLKAARIRGALAEIAYRDLNNSLFNISVYLKKMDRAEEGEQYLNQILQNNAENKFHYQALNSLAILKAEKGDFFEALQYLDKLFHTIDQEKFVAILIEASKHGIWIYSEMPHPEVYFNEINKLEEELISYELEEEEMVNAYNNLGTIYSRMNDNEKAIEYYFKVEKVHSGYQDSIGLGRVYNNLGSQYALLGQKVKAETYLTKALRYADQETRAFIYNNQGFYLHENDPRQRLVLYQKAINTVLNREKEAVEINVLPALASIESSANRLDVLGFLIDKAMAWVDLFEIENSKQHLLNAKATLYLLDRLVSIVRQNSESEQSKLLWINHGVDSYVLATKVCFLLGAPPEAFYFMEKNKSLLLLENLARASHENTKMLEISSLVEARERHVSAKENLIEFIINENDGFGLFLQEENTYFFELANVPELLANIAHLKRMVESPFTSKEEFAAFDQLSHTVFNELFPFADASSLLAGKKLIVVPDYELHGLPFEILTTKLEEHSYEKSYLMNTTEISYLHSCSVDQQIEQLETDSEYGMIGFVPTIFDNDTLADLRLSEIEMKEIAAFFPGQLVLREQATKASFIKSLDQYRIIHINSHAGYTQNSTPWLSFYDQKVSLEELTGYSNHSNLVILDACKSALGEQKLGEGIMSLARAFFYGGSASVIASQWQVNEKSSGEIFKAFYKNLKAGESKSQALHHAKQAYLSANQLSQLSPYYWASFTLTGDAGQVIIEENNYWTKVLIALSSFLLLAFLAKRFWG